MMEFLQAMNKILEVSLNKALLTDMFKLTGEHL